MEQIELEDASRTLAVLVDHVNAGESVVLTHGGHPVALLTAVAAADNQSMFGCEHGLTEAGEDLHKPIPEFAEYM